MNLALPLLLWVSCVAGSHWMTRRRGKQGLPWVALAGWLALPPYNACITHGCPGDCGIRVDILLAGPALLALTLATILDWAGKRLTAHRSSKRQDSREP